MILSPRLARAVVTVAALGTTLVAAPPAEAHGTSISMGWGHGGVTHSHKYVYACDDRGDTRRVYTEFVAAGNPYVRDRVYDLNSSSPGCTQVGTPAGPIFNYRVCRDERLARDICSKWRGST